MKRSEMKILEALNNKKYNFRTISGVSKEVGLNKEEVINLINGSLRKQVKVYPRKSKEGKTLITTNDRFQKEASFGIKLMDTFNTKSGGYKIDD